MDETRHVVRRRRRAAELRFPVLPTLPADTAADGAAFILTPGAPAPALGPLREMITGLWRGPLGDHDVLIAQFLQPVRLDPALAASALPLSAAGGVLASYVRRGAGAAARTAGARRVALWWGGQEHQLTLDAMTPVSIATLWAPPVLFVNEPSAPWASAAPADGAAVISHASAVVLQEGGDPIGEVAADLKRFEERTRLSAILGQMFKPGTRLLGGGGGAGKGGKGQGGGGQPGDPGLLQSLGGWLRWHTPLGNGLRMSFSQRMEQVEKLIAAGDLDRALKLAIKLGGADLAGKKKRSLFPAGLPPMRDSLDFSFEITRVAPILGDGAYLDTHERYRRLAQQLERQGDHRRAAYIHSQLLDNQAEAARVLEAGGLFREAARLALASKLDAATSIRLLFLAGEEDAALALARRTGAFEQLAEQSHKASHAAFHASVILAWTDALAATGQYMRALRVTDALVTEKALAATLPAARQQWLLAAIEAGGRDETGTELMVRTLLASPWGEGGIGLEDLPRISDLAAAGPCRPVLEDLQRILRGETDAAAHQLVELLGAMMRLADPERAEQAVFWRGPAPAVMEALAYAAFEVGSSKLGNRTMGALRVLLPKARLPVLAADIGKLTKILREPAGKAEPWIVPPPHAISPAARRACILANGHMLVWRESQVLQLLDRFGRVLWAQTVGDVAALVAVGSSPNALIVQVQRDGQVTLTRFATHRRTLHPIGGIDLRACHDVTSDTQWLVQIGGEIGALDLVKLCAPEPQVEFLWASSLTERLQAVAFYHDDKGAGWITRDVSPGRQDLLEAWLFETSGALKSWLCEPPQTSTDREWRWIGAVWPQLAANGPAETWGWMTITAWTMDAERAALLAIAKRRAAGRIEDYLIQSCDLGRPYVSRERTKEGMIQTAVRRTANKEALFIFEHQAQLGLVCLARNPAWMQARDARHIGLPQACLFASDDGRLFIVDATRSSLVAV